MWLLRIEFSIIKIGKYIKNHGWNTENTRKHNKISGNWNIWNLVPRDFSVFLILRDNNENWNGNSVLAFNLEKGESETVIQRCSIKKVFLEISQISQENTCARVSFLMKLQASGLWWLLYNRIHDGPFRGCSPMGAGAKRSPSLKSLTHILNWWNLAQLYLT